MIGISIPKWAYSTCLDICEMRVPKFRNQFITSKLKQAARNDKVLRKNIEGVIGYIGDICASLFLGIDPKLQFRRMLLDTDLLTHRDKYDLNYNGWRIDVKTELVPSKYFASIVTRSIESKEAYGCRLINATQYKDNSGSVDIYFFGLLDDPDPRVAKNWYPVGYLTSEETQGICPEPKLVLSNKRRIHVPAYEFPTSSLHDPKRLSEFQSKPKSLNNLEKINQLEESLGEHHEEYLILCKVFNI